jgi:hypothetical protein
VNPDTSNAIIGQWGAFGAIFLLTMSGLAYWIVRLQRALDTAQDKRVLDAQGVADRVLNLADTHSESDQQSAVAMQAQATAMSALVQELRDLRDELRVRRVPGR